jgi:ribosomal protein S27AE
MVDILVQKGGNRLQCPKCGNYNKNMIREVEDHSHIINDYPVIYGKKNLCGKCGSTWIWERPE